MFSEHQLELLWDCWLLRPSGRGGVPDDDHLSAAQSLAEAGWLRKESHPEGTAYFLTDKAELTLDAQDLTATAMASVN